MERISRIGRIIILFGIAFLCSLVINSIFLIDVGLSIRHIFTFVAHVLPVPILVCLPMLLLWPRCQYVSLAILTVITIFLYINILYYRNFTDLISVSTMSLATSVDSIIVKSVIASMRPVDLFMCIPLVGLYIAIRNLHPLDKLRILSVRVKLFALILSVAVLFVVNYKHYRDFKIFSNSIGQLSEACSFSEAIKSFFNRRISFYCEMRNHGLWMAYILDFYRTYNIKARYKAISGDDIMDISSWKSGGDEKYETLSSGKKQNLIFIIVESLNTLAIDWNWKGMTAMPSLNKIISDSSCISFTSMYPQVGNGRSSDGQMMYHTGIYPSADTPMCVVDPDGPYVSLARLMPPPTTSMEIITEAPRLWNHSSTTKAFGFDSLNHSVAEDMQPAIADSVLFARACDIIQSTVTPFYAVLTTISMHDPYIQSEWGNGRRTWISEIQDMDERDKTYLEACAVFDRALGRFMDWFWQSPLKDNTMIVIASDHEAREMYLSPEMSDGRLFFAILNSGRNGFRCDKTVGQIDVFPTVVDAMGLWDSVSWRGFGSSLLREIPGFALRHDGSVVGDTTKSDMIERQRLAVELSQKWIYANNKKEILDSLKIYSSVVK